MKLTWISWSNILLWVALMNAVCIGGDFEKGWDSIVLRDCFGKSHPLSALKDSQAVVVFLGTECPLAKLYGPKLQTLSERFRKDGVAMMGVFSNVQDSLSEVIDYANKAGITFPMLIDNDQQLADLLQANRTPEALVLDLSRSVQYRGRIDDQYAISVARKAPTREDLAEAIQSVVNGEKPDVASVPSVGCVIGRKNRIVPHGDVTFSKHIAPIMNARCVECHRPGEIAPFPLTSYEDTIGWEATIAEVVREERMPPWNANPKIGHFKNDARLSEVEKQLIQSWIENGCPEGNPSDSPRPPIFVAGWRMPDPDLVIPMRDEPFKIPATGVVEYQYFQVDPKFSEDKYIIASEARPGNATVVHHIIAYLVIPGQEDVGLGKLLIGYSPGTSPLIYPKDSAVRVPAGSKILFEVHYTPNGTEQTDRSYIGLKFTDASTVKNEVVGLQAINEKLQIPAGADHHVVTAQERIGEDVALLSLTPHMHLRGKTFRYDARYPDGTEETLLDVPRYDFNWQLRYEFAEPKLIPKGTVVTCTATYDNSTANPNNPDATKQVTWGQQSWEEMMIGFFNGIRPLQAVSQ
ncbi:MAG: redoxin domain-containing protein [Pirellulaceae bacterium]|nr:redoxin domain-containing protein [Pirellulaceae bacterium]